MTETLRRRDLIAQGIAPRTASRWIARAKAEGRAANAPAEVGNGAVRSVGAMVVVRETPHRPEAA